MENEEFDKRQDEKQKRFSGMRGIMDYGMGILWCMMGIFLLFPEKFSKDFSQFSDPVFKIFAGVCVVYGIFRIYGDTKKILQRIRCTAISGLRVPFIFYG